MRDWWLRTLLVLQAPRAVFVALRDDSRESAADRSEPVLLILLLAGMASVLSTPVAGRLMSPPNEYDGLVVAVWTFVGGGIYGAFAYWLFGALLHGGVKALGSQGTFRRTRHVLAFAAVPLALSFLLWPVKVAVYGGDVFRRGGDDTGAGADAFVALELALLAWTVALLVVGVRAVHGWTWARAAAAVAIAVAVPVALGVAFR